MTFSLITQRETNKQLISVMQRLSQLYIVRWKLGLKLLTNYDIKQNELQCQKMVLFSLFMCFFFHNIIEIFGYDVTAEPLEVSIFSP